MNFMAIPFQYRASIVVQFRRNRGGCALELGSPRTYSPPASSTLTMTPKQRRRLAFAMCPCRGRCGRGRAHRLRAQGQCSLFLQPERRRREAHRSPGVAFRVGGLVEKQQRDSTARAPTIHFVITDGRARVPVDYHRRAAGAVPRRAGRGGDGRARTVAAPSRRAKSSPSMTSATCRRKSSMR